MMKSVFLGAALSILSAGVAFAGTDYEGVTLGDNTSITPTYSASADITGPALGVWFSLCGSSTEVIAVRGVRISGQATSTSYSAAIIDLIKTSSAPTGGTSSTAPNAIFDSNDSAPTATAKYYTAAPTAGTAAGYPALLAVGFPTQATEGASGIPAKWEPSPGEKPIVLRGASQCLEINGLTSPLTLATVLVTVDWTEVPSFP